MERVERQDRCSDVDSRRWRAGVRPGGRFYLAAAVVAITHLAAVAGLASAAGSTGSDEPDRPAAVAVDLARVMRIFETESGRELSLEQLIERLATVEVAFLGETHLDEVTHRVEQAILEGLARHTDGKVVLAMEMFERDVQGVLDDYLAGKISEADLLRDARPWSNYRTGYRPLIETAKAYQFPVVASNTPREARMKIAMGDSKEVYESIVAEGNDWLPPKLYPESDEYWERMARSVRGHAYMIMGGSAEDRLYSGQSLWDNTMGYSCAQAVERYPDSVIVHVNGGFHSGHRLGTVEQLLIRRPETRVACVEIGTTHDLAAAAGGDSADADYADYVIVAEARARGLSEGTHAVITARELPYRLIVPHGMTGSEPRPLLIWLADDGIRAEDAQTLMQASLGHEVLVAVVEHLYPQVEDQLYRGGRWFWHETFDKDQSVMQAGLQRLAGYLARHYPVDAEHLVIAGEGTGATVVASMALFTPLPARMIAVSPRRYEKVRDLPLPDEAAGESDLEVITLEGDNEWWEKEAADRDGVGLVVEVAMAEPGEIDVTAMAAIRRALGLDVDGAASGEPDLLLVRFDSSALSRSWAHLAQVAMQRDGRSVAVVAADGLEDWLAAHPGASPAIKPLAFAHELGDWQGPASLENLGGWQSDDLADGAALPLAPNPFGGTTVLVVPGTLSADARAGWLSLQEEDVIKKRSRFASLAVAFTEGGRRLADVLEEIKARGRKVAHIVPAVACASAELMRALRSEAGPYLESMQITWLPGLGGELAALDETAGH